MQTHLSPFAVFGLLAAVATASAATTLDPTTRAVNASAETVISFNSGALFGALLSAGIPQAETAAQVHLVVIITVALWEPHAACHPTALGFFADRVPIPPAVCANKPLLHSVAGLTLHRLLRLVGRGGEAKALAKLLGSLSIPADNLRTKDTGSPQGWANVRAARLARYFTNDGWNILGDRTRRYNRQPYADPTGYKPVNSPYGRPGRPLRWTPLVQQKDTAGRFATQAHVFPHIGWIARPLIIGTRELHARKLKSPYVAANARRGLSPRDRRSVQAGLDGLLKVQRMLTRQQRYEALWWDDKIASLGEFAVFYQRKFGLSEFDLLRIGLGEILARHDATIAAWRAKRAHDLVRPSTLMHLLRAGKRARALLPGPLKVKKIDLGEWEPLIPAQPHSEFPSGSAAICRASLDHMRLLGEEFTGGKPLPPFEMNLTGFARRKGLELPFRVRFATMTQAYRNCGESRLWAGVHFPPAVTGGYVIAKDLGRLAYEHVRDLTNGKAPKVCERCF